MNKQRSVTCKRNIFVHSIFESETKQKKSPHRASTQL